MKLTKEVKYYKKALFNALQKDCCKEDECGDQENLSILDQIENLNPNIESGK